jgi:hypothetical protein
LLPLCEEGVQEGLLGKVAFTLKPFQTDLLPACPLGYEESVRIASLEPVRQLELRLHLKVTSHKDMSRRKEFPNAIIRCRYKSTSDIANQQETHNIIRSLCYTPKHASNIITEKNI